ncbi:shikimate kinase [Paenibacillus sp. FSL R5-0749]|uniref:shikimate kinase n=1 Tax=Paenibacillus sp. FSL R5-0749 TaxID=2921657 RepID=UPI00315A897A
MRIRIIGSCGSGKSTLAKELSDIYGIPSYELDNLIWNRTHMEQKRRKSEIS